MEATVVLLVLSVAALLLVLLSQLKSSLLVAKPKHNNLPPGPWTLPAIGNLHHLIGSPNLHHALRRLSQQHGPIMMLRLGEVRAMVVSSPEAALEVFKTHDITFAERFTNATTAVIGFDGSDIGFAPYGERWRQLRKICVLELLSAARVLSFRCIREEEVRRFMENLALRQTSGLGVADLFPSSRLMQVLDTAPRKVLACRNRIQRILELRLQKERSTPIPLDDGTIIAVMFNLFTAGSETSATVLTWCMTELVRNPKAMARAQVEVREAYHGKNTIVEDDDLKGLTYLKLVIKEALRLHTPAPIIPRKCRGACQVMGYDVPKGTAMFVNLWAICRDPKYWDDPEEFKPERFEDSDLDYKGTNYKFLPFGAGRRICPGINLGVGNIDLALASLLYHFDWKLPEGIEANDVDVSEAVGLVASKKTSLIVHPVPRIPLAPANV
ncbi:unnamed protein product [Urochloa decumbens]|uniref:Cytochrome P450 n=1 Tax=Urochloa decumbens TaxID=240449 RepID=A0ABC9HBD5_9POAL